MHTRQHQPRQSRSPAAELRCGHAECSDIYQVQCPQMDYKAAKQGGLHL